MTHGMPIPLENGIEHSQDSWATMSGGIGVVGDGNPTVAPRRLIDMDNGMVDSRDNWNTTTERTIYQRNGIVQNANNWNLPHGNGIGESKNSGTAVTSDEHINQNSNPIPVEMQEKQSETENWSDLIGMYTNLLQESTFDTDGILENDNPTPPVGVHNNGNQSYVASTTERNFHQKPNSSVYQNQASNQGSSALSYFNTSLTSKPGSQQTQRFTSNNLITNEYRPKDGFPVTGQYYSPSSPPRFISVAAASSITNSFAPVTPENQKRHINSQSVPEKVDFLVEETRMLSKDGHESQTVSIKDAENLYNELLQTINDSPSSAISATEKENIVSEDKDEQDTVLNKTPNQKTPTRRKKHRPKVIREGKPKRTPKDSKNNSSNEIRVKRKYVKRKGVINSNEKTPVEKVKRKYVRKKVRDNLKSQQKSTGDDVEMPPKSCKKLNFDLEDVVQNSSQQGTNVNVNPQEIEKQRMFQKPMQGEKQQKVLPELDGPTSYHALNMTTFPNQDRWDNGYNKVNGHVHEKGTTDIVLQAGMGSINPQGTLQSVKGEGMVSLDERRGIKRQSSDQMECNVNAMNSLLLYQKMLLGVANRAYHHNNLSNVLFESQKKMKIESKFQDNSRRMKGVYANGSTMGLLNSSTGRINPCYKMMNVGENVRNRQFLTPMVARYYLQKQQVLSGMQPHTMRSTPYTQGAIVSWNPPQPTTPKWASSYAVTAYAKLENKQMVKPNIYNQKLNGLDEMLQQHRNNSVNSYRQFPKMPRGRPKKQKAVEPVDDITNKLQSLHIYDGNKKQQSELVLYRGSEAIIPFQPIKKRTPRPKVDLDPETVRLWNLLMGIEGNEGAETLDKDKEKWWENERRVFRGRADSFIARMHLVQGDRRFSRWKGSVVDSVIGVFLTQNVSDHLSSSAFISLAAKFPLKSKTAEKTCCQQPPRSQEANDIIKCHEKMASPEEEVILTQDSFDSSTILTVDELTSSSGSNSEAEDVTTGFEISQQSDTPQKEESIMHKDHSCYANQNTLLDDLATNTQIPRMNGINLYSSSNRFQAGMPVDLRTFNSGVMNPHDITCPQNETRKLQTLSLDQYNLLNNVEDKISVMDKQNCFENTVTEANSKEQKTSHKLSIGTAQKAEKEINEEKKKREFDWDSLRKEALFNGKMKERSKDAMDSIDYEAMRRASVNEISDAIKERGMNNLLADRIKDFLNRLVRDHGSIDLEWLRDAPPDKAKDYLLSFRGLGLKSVECVRLLTLHHLAFPVDTNVGRIAVRLGWVPLQPLPESLQLHLLEMYPVLESIQKYIWPRLCKLDQLTLYELHYQMITFGKVFCTKSKPNCNACPMRSECRHFASAFASARLALPGPEEKRIVTSDAPVKTDPIPPIIIRPTMPLPPAENELNNSAEISGRNCEPIIEEPTTPEPEVNELSISDIEDQYYEDSDEIPSIKLNMEEFTTNLQNILQDNKELQGDMSKALVTLNPNAASIPTPKLKDVSRLRTEHLVYELPDSHQLLEGLDKREADDPSPYLLAIWTPGETANSVQPPERDCTAQQSGQLCDQTTCFSCNCIKEANSQVVRGTILIPCRTAMHGSFPLNGTYFQVNEMFADHASSMNPIDVPRAWIWNLPRRKVYFGTSVSTIFKGLTTEGIQYCFWKGFVCVRGFDRINRTPRPLMARLHFPASKLLTQKKKENK